MYALFRDGRMISKPFTTQDACAIEATAKGLTKRMPIMVETILAEGVTIGNLDPVVKP